MHGITHVAGGPDPVPGLLPALPGSFNDWVFALPGVWGYWPLQDASGDAVDQGALHADMQPIGSPAYHATGPNSSDLAYAVHLDGSADTTITGDSFYNTANELSMFSHTAITAMCWVKYDGAASAAWELPIIGTWDVFRTGWILEIGNTTRQLTFNAGDGSSSDFLLGPTVPADAWALVAVTRSTADGVKLYLNGSMVASAAAGPFHGGPRGIRVGAADFDAGAADAYTFQGELAGAVYVAAVLTAGQILEGFNAGAADAATGIVVAGGPGSVLGIDDSGHVAWVKPPAPAVTVNGSSEPAAKTPKPTPPAPPPPDTDPVTVLMIDQPFLHNGTTFTVAPKVWTTIPFTSSYMERMSDKTGVSAWAEIPISDPDAAGWLHADSPHTITVPHDMPFLAEAMLQICLRIDNPIVEGATSHRALRVLETTHQRTLLEVRSEQADGAGAEGGMTDVFRGPGITVFASGDTGSTGTHPDIFFLPNFGLAFYPTGYDWLPYIGGVQSLRAGMRLVAQCWHDASVPLTFSCAPGTTYKPHFVLNTQADPAWGPPWSTWL
jgi:hypothetical protein